MWPDNLWNRQFPKRLFFLTKYTILHVGRNKSRGAGGKHGRQAVCTNLSVMHILDNRLHSVTEKQQHPQSSAHKEIASLRVWTKIWNQHTEHGFPCKWKSEIIPTFISVFSGFTSPNLNYLVRRPIKVTYSHLEKVNYVLLKLSNSLKNLVKFLIYNITLHRILSGSKTSKTKFNAVNKDY